jgi:hypothetical protein
VRRLVGSEMCIRDRLRAMRSESNVCFMNKKI